MFTMTALCELKEGVRMVRMGRLFAQNDKLAHTVTVNVVENGVAADLSGLSASGYFVRADEATVTVAGTISGNAVSVTLPAACYEVPGHFSMIIRVYDTTHTATVFWGDGTITRSETDSVVDPTHVVPDLATLLAQIAAMEQATSDAATAIQSANDAAEAANSAASAANTKAELADQKATLADQKATAANSAAEAAAAAAQQVTDAIVPEFSIGTVTDVSASQGAGASITGTAKNPVLNLQIPRGLDGSGSVVTVGGISPDGNGNIPLTVAGQSPNASTGAITLTAANVGAVPTAREVNGHALSSDVTLTASDVGAVPATRTVNGKALSSDVSLTASDVGAVTGDYRYTVQVGNTGWTNGGTTTGYYKTVAVNGITSSDVATLALHVEDASTVAEKRTAFACVYRAVTGTDSITLYATADPDTPFYMDVKVVR